LRPADNPDSIGLRKGLRLHQKQRCAGIPRPLQIELAIEAPLRTHFALIARSETVDHRHDEAAPGEFDFPVTFAATNQAGGSIEHTVTAMQKTSAEYLPLPVGRNM
jgi:hypothetical protein